MAVTYERRGATRIVTIDRPERRNAVDRETAEALRARYYEFVEDAGARVLVVTGAGGQAFCAGADLKAMNSPVVAPEGPKRCGVTRYIDGLRAHPGKQDVVHARRPGGTRRLVGVRSSRYRGLWQRLDRGRHGP